MRYRRAGKGAGLKIAIGNAKGMAVVAALIAAVSPLSAFAQERPSNYVAVATPVSIQSRSLAWIVAGPVALTPALPNDMALLKDDVVRLRDPNWIADFAVKVGDFIVNLDSDNADPTHDPMANADVVVSLHRKF